MVEDINSYAELGAVAVLAVAFMFVLRTMLTNFRESLQAIAETNVQQTKEVQINRNMVLLELRGLSAVQLTTQQMLLAQTLTTVGIAPDADPADLAEPLRILHARYAQMFSAIEEEKTELKRLSDRQMDILNERSRA